MGKRKTNEQFLKEVYGLVNNEYTFLEEYKGAGQKILIRHNCNKCNNYEWKVSPNNFLSKSSRCPKCYGNVKKTTEQFEKEVYELVGEEYIVIGEYTQAQTSISMKHITCNTEYKVTPDNFLRGERCSECNGGIRKTLEKFKQDVYNIFQDEYSVIGEYTNRNKKILMKHNICGCEFDTTPRDFLNKESKCPNCNKSNAENITRKKLNILDLNFDSEYKFENCINPKTNRKLSFDFAVFVDNIILFELDGQHHFKPVRFGGISMEVALVKFKEQKIRDKIKNKYCKQNNIKLIRIPYWDFDRIEEILDKELKYYKQCASL